MSGSTIRLSLDVSPELNAALESLADRLGITKADVLRRAIVLYDVATKAKAAGQRVGIARFDQIIAVEILI